MQLGVIDDIALLAETDIRNKEKIAQRKSLYAQLSGQVEQLSEANKDKDGTIETLERQLVQAGIKNKVMQASVEINKKKEEVKGDLESEVVKGAASMNIIEGQLKNNVAAQNQAAGMAIKDAEREAKAQQKETLTQK